VSKSDGTEPNNKLIISFLVFGVLVGVILFAAGTAKKKDREEELKYRMSLASKAADIKPVEVKPYTAWSTHNSVDEMTGGVSAYATSEMFPASAPMAFPYSDITSYIGIGCDKSSLWAYVGFSDIPNLMGGDWDSDGRTYNYRVRWDSEVIKTSFYHSVGGRAIHFNNELEAVNLIKAHKIMRLEVNWHGNGLVYFDYNLTGSSKAISEMMNTCGR